SMFFLCRHYSVLLLSLFTTSFAIPLSSRRFRKANTLKMKPFDRAMLIVAHHHLTE
uniref:Uncharacterized protein n=1 Tax=Parascaris univalens TaxID=6257 RepID=A0A915B4K6_PARUN